jgi:hypothetical protein
MARKLELTRIPDKDRSTPRWRKKYKGKPYYFTGGYDQALKAWHRKLTELEQEPEEEEPDWYRKTAESIREWYLAQGDHEAAARIADDLSRKDDDLLKKNWGNLSDATKCVWVDRIRLMEQKPTNEPHTVHQALTSFLAKARVKAEAGAISAGYYDLLQRTLNDFADHVGRRVAVDGITGHALESYHTELIQHTEWSKDYAAGRMRHVKSFVNWCYDMELMKNLPRIMRRGNKTLAIATGNKKKPTFTNDEVKILLDNASERTQLYLLLMANCGFTQIDLSELRPDQVGWKEGRITRKRSKTEQHESVPEVSYPLWKRTFDLLKRFGKRKGDRVLVNEHGKPLKVEELRGGKLVKIDNVATAYARLVRKLMKKKDGKPALLTKKKSLKAFRKTSPSRLEDSQFATCARWFGGWSPKSVADRHYITPPQVEFDRAVMWLAQSYGIAK